MKRVVILYLLGACGGAAARSERGAAISIAISEARAAQTSVATLRGTPGDQGPAGPPGADAFTCPALSCATGAQDDNQFVCSACAPTHFGATWTGTNAASGLSITNAGGGPALAARAASVTAAKAAIFVTDTAPSGEGRALHVIAGGAARPAVSITMAGKGVALSADAPSGGTAISAEGGVDFGAASVRLPITTVYNAGNFALCPSTAIAIGGGCAKGVGCILKTSGYCLGNTLDPSQGAITTPVSRPAQAGSAGPGVGYYCNDAGAIATCLDFVR